MKVATNGKLHEIASMFLYGREDPIPKMFQSLLNTLEREHLKVPNLKIYLERHIDVDGDIHEPMAQRMLSNILGSDE